MPIFFFNPLPDDNFRLVQIETNCRQHFKVHLKWKINTIKARKHCEKRRNCLLQAISPFLTRFSTAIYLEYVKMRYCVVWVKKADNNVRKCGK